MARLTNNNLNSGSGSLGSVVVYNMYGKSYMRSKPTKYTDRKSPAQLAQRQKMEKVKDFLQPFKDLVRITFAGEAVGHSAYHSAYSYNMHSGLQGEYPEIEINKQSALLSKGPLPLPENAQISIGSEGILFQWDDIPENKSAGSNMLIVMAKHISGNAVDFRLTGTSLLEKQFLWKTRLPLDSPADLDIWLAFQKPGEMKMSNSLYLTL